MGVATNSIVFDVPDAARWLVSRFDARSVDHRRDMALTTTMTEPEHRVADAQAQED